MIPPSEPKSAPWLDWTDLPSARASKPDGGRPVFNILLVSDFPELSAHLRAWIESWSSVNSHAPALVALFDTEHPVPAATLICNHLRLKAINLGMDFVSNTEQAPAGGQFQTMPGGQFQTMPGGEFQTMAGQRMAGDNFDSN